MQFAWEGDILKSEEQEIIVDEPSSLYTNLIMKGIESGDADLNGDGVIACGELNEYIMNKMRESSHPQNPEINLLKGDFTIAHNKKIGEKGIISFYFLESKTKRTIRRYKNYFKMDKYINLTV